jgi:hypothetical protein
MEIEVQPLDYLGQMKLAETMAFSGMGREWWNDTIHAASVRAIDGVQIARPTKTVHFRDIMRRLGDDGMAIVVQKHAEYREPGEPPDVMVKKLNALERWDLKLIAEHRYDVPAWANLAYIACMVRTINGENLDFPADLNALYERVKMLGIHGIGAAAKTLTAPAEENE